MSTITTRAGKGSPLTNNEVDANFTNLNTDKAELSGATFTGEITANGGIALGDNDKATFGAGDDLQIYHDGSDSFISDQGAGNLKLLANDFRLANAANNELMIKADQSGAVDLRYAGAAKLTTTSTGIDVTGVITTDGMTTSADVNFGDNDKAIFGASDDLQIYHDGSNSYIRDLGQGNLYITANEFRVGNADNSKDYIHGNNGAEVKLFYNNSQKLATTSTGIDVTGTVTADELTVDGTNGAYTIASNGNDFYYGRNGSNYHIAGTANGAFNFLTGASSANRLKIASNGDISFYEDTGTTPKLFWDASAESLGIGTTSPSAEAYSKLTVDSGTANAAYSATGFNASHQVRIDVASAQNNYAGIGFSHSGNTEGFIGLVRPSTTTSEADFVIQGYSGSASGYREKLRITDAGNVGIGSTGRLMSGYDGNSKTLTVYDSDGSAQSGYLELASLANNNGYNTGAITFVNNANSNNSSPESANSKTVATIRAETVTSDNNAGDDAGASLTIFTKPEAGGLTERMRIDSSGRVGIGVSSVFRKLQVADSAFFGTTNSGVVAGDNGGIASVYGMNAAGDTYKPFEIRTGSSGTGFNQDTSGRVGIGTSSPSAKGHISYTTAATANKTYGLIVNGNDAGAVGESASILLGGVNTDARGASISAEIQNSANAHDLIFATSSASATPSEAMRLDSSGNLLVGKSSAAFGTAGVELKSSGETYVTRASGTPLHVRRNTDDGALVGFWKDGTSVGSIGVQAAGFTIDGEAGHTGLQFGSSAIIPRDNGSNTNGANDLGASVHRFRDLYLSGYAYVGALKTNSSVESVGNLTFWVPNVGEAVRIEQNTGSLLVGTTSKAGVEKANITFDRTSEWGLVIANTSSTAPNNATMVEFKYAGSTTGYIGSNGTTTTYNTSSDQRLKENIADADDAGSKIDSIQVRKYDWKADGSHQDYGMVAQELQTVAPEAVSVPEDSEEMMGVDYSKLVPMLIKEIQSLRNRVAQLEE